VNKLKFKDQQLYMEGIVVEIQDGAVGMDLKGRLGFFKVPRRMIVTDYEIKLGQEIGFMMSFPEVLSGEPSEHYISNMKKLQKEDK
jgi:hypothetical protein